MRQRRTCRRGQRSKPHDDGTSTMTQKQRRYVVPYPLLLTVSGGALPRRTLAQRQVSSPHTLLQRPRPVFAHLCTHANAAPIARRRRAYRDRHRRQVNPLSPLSLLLQSPTRTETTATFHAQWQAHPATKRKLLFPALPIAHAARQHAHVKERSYTFGQLHAPPTAAPHLWSPHLRIRFRQLPFPISPMGVCPVICSSYFLFYFFHHPHARERIRIRQDARRRWPLRPG